MVIRRRTKPLRVQILANGKKSRFDNIDKSIEPDLIGTITDMNNVTSGSMDAIYSSHNIELQYYAHEVEDCFLEEFLKS